MDKNTKEGLPAYIIVDMTTQEGQLVRLPEGMKYSPCLLYTSAPVFTSITTAEPTAGIASLSRYLSTNAASES